MRVRRLAGALAGLAITLLTACSTPATRVVLLPQADGKPSSVVVRANNEIEETLSRPYQRATVRANARGAPVVDQIDPARVQAENRMLFEAMPPPAQRYTVYFDLGGTVLTATSQIAMNDALTLARSRDGAEIVVTGHTDTVGSGARNDDLSRRRAQQVRQLLAARVADPRRIEVVARGERELAVQTGDDIDEPRNRRVTIDVR